MELLEEQAKHTHSKGTMPGGVTFTHWHITVPQRHTHPTKFQPPEPAAAAARLAEEAANGREWAQADAEDNGG